MNKKFGNNQGATTSITNTTTTTKQSNQTTETKPSPVTTEKSIRYFLKYRGTK